MTDPDQGIDDLTLKWDGAARESIKLIMVGVGADRIGIEGFGDYMRGPDGMGMWGDSTVDVEERFYEVDEVSFELLFALTGTDDQTIVNWVLMVVTEVNPDAWVMATLVTTEEYIEDTYKDLSNLVILDGEGPIRLSSWRDIERAISQRG